MNKFLFILLLFMSYFINANAQQNEEEYYKNTVLKFYKFLYQSEVSIKDFSSIYVNASLHFDSRSYIRDSMGLDNPNWMIEEKRNKSVKEEETPSYIHKKIKREFNNLTFGLTYDQIAKTIENSVVSSQGLEFSKIVELNFPNNKKVYFEVNNDTPTQVIWVWENNASLLDDIINNVRNPQKLFLAGTIIDPDGFVNIREALSYNSKVVGTLTIDDIFFYNPDNEEKWWKVYSEENWKSFLGYVHCSRINNYNNLPIKQKLKIFEKRN